MPLADWFRGDLRDFAAEVLLDPGTRARGYFRDDEVRRMLDRHAAEQTDDAPRIWAMLMLELWHREFVDRPPSRQRVAA